MAKTNYHLDTQMFKSDYWTQEDNNGRSSESASSFIYETIDDTDSTMTTNTKDPCQSSGNMVNSMNHQGQPQISLEHLGKSIVH
jgi:hypothetical protein